MEEFLEEFLDTLKNHILFKDIERGNLKEVLKCLNAYVRHYGKNEAICKAGGEVTEMGIIVKGSAHISKMDMQGNRMILRELQTGHSFGESAALSGLEKNPLSVTAVTNCSVVFVSVKKVIECDAKIRENLVTLLSQKNIALLFKNDILSKKTIRERLTAYFYYQKCITGGNKLKTALTKEELADYLSVNRSAMSRELGKMKREGLLTYNKNSFTIKTNIYDDEFE